MKENGLMEKTIVISVDEWHELTLDNAFAEVKIQLAGYSMQPLIRRNKDFVTIRPLTRNVLAGDIVLFKNIDGRYIVHRVRKISGDRVQTMGDNRLEPDREISAHKILGYVTHIRRGEHTYFVDTPMWRLFGRFWLSILPLRKTVGFLFGFLKKMLGRVIR